MTQANRERCRGFIARLREDDSSRSSESVVVLTCKPRTGSTYKPVLELFVGSLQSSQKLFQTFVKYYSPRPQWFVSRTILVRMRRCAH